MIRLRTNSIQLGESTNRTNAIFLTMKMQCVVLFLSSYKQSRAVTLFAIGMTFRKRRCTMLVEDLDTEARSVRELRGQTPLSRDAAILVLHAYYSCMRKVKISEFSGPANMGAVIPELTGVSHHAVYEIVKHYETEREGDNDPTKLVRAPNFPGKFSNKPSRISHGNAMYCMV